MLLPLQGEVCLFAFTQGVALGWEQVAPYGAHLLARAKTKRNTSLLLNSLCYTLTRMCF